MTSIVFRLPVTILLLMFLSISVHAREAEALESDTLLAEVNGTFIPHESFKLLYSVVSGGKGAMTRQQLLESSIESRILALYGESTLGSAALKETTAVGYPVDVLLNDELVGILRLNFQDEINAHIDTKFHGKLENLVSVNPSLSDSLVPAQQGLLLDHRLDDELKAKYQDISVATVSLVNGGSRSLTLYELFEAQNVQGKISIRNADIHFIQTQAVIALSKVYFTDWLLSTGKINEESLNGLNRLVWDKHVKGKVLLAHGLNNDIHDDNQVLSEAYKKITQAEIDDFYGKNKEQFSRIVSVDARHIRLANESDARSVQKALGQGMDFSEAVKKYSIADDKHLNPPGSLGRISGDAEKDWLHTVVFALNAGIPSRPFRSPQAEGREVFWEIFLVDKKEMGFYPADSETVRYVAGKDIAMQKLKESFRNLRQRLFDAATIKLNFRLMKLSSQS